MRPKVIKNEEEYAAALARVDSIIAARPGSPAFEELEVWVCLIEAYENTKHPIDMPDPVSAIRFRMEQQGLKRQDLVPFIGSRSKVSEVLNGKRRLSIAMIRRLHDGLGIPADILLRNPGRRERPRKETGPALATHWPANT